MSRTTKSLKARAEALSDTQRQMEWLSNGIFSTDNGTLPRFDTLLKRHHIERIRPKKLEIVQLNLGYMCNQVCAHCHVDAGPDRKEMMTRQTLEQCLEVLKIAGATTLDLTGGAPEMHPDFRWFVEKAAQIGVDDLIVRSNLTILLANKKYYDLPEFFKQYRVHVISSLPFYKRSKTDRQRGKGVFDQSITALQRLNDVGYGKPESPLQLGLDNDR